MSDKETVIRLMPGLPTLATLLLLYLKVTGQIDWSWVWVLCPLWIGFALFAAFLVLIFGGTGLFLGVAYVADMIIGARRRSRSAAKFRARLKDRR